MSIDGGGYDCVSELCNKLTVLTTLLDVIRGFLEYNIGDDESIRDSDLTITSKDQRYDKS